MKKTGEWGMPLPPSLSPFGYNETIAQEFYPLNEKETLEKGWNWHAENNDKIAVYQGPRTEAPNHIKDAGNDIPDRILMCKKCSKPYKIIPRELELYKKHNSPLPHICFSDRHLARIQKRNPRQLWNRWCQKCNKPLMSTYSQERPETIFCEECYLKTIYG